MSLPASHPQRAERERLLAAAMDAALWTISGRGEAAYRHVSRQMGSANRAAAKRLGVKKMGRLALARAAMLGLVVSQTSAGSGDARVVRWRLTAKGLSYVSAARGSWNGPGGRPPSSR